MGHAIGRSGLGIACHIFNEAPFFFSNILWWNGLLRGLNRATAALSDPLFSVFIDSISHKMLIFTWKTLFKIASNNSQPPLERPKHVKCEKSAEALGFEVRPSASVHGVHRPSLMRAVLIKISGGNVTPEEIVRHFWLIHGGIYGLIPRTVLYHPRPVQS